jgi:hypothetical protein
LSARMQVDGPANGMDEEIRRWRELTYVFEGVIGTLPAPDLSMHPMASDCDAHPCRPNGMHPPSIIRI